MEKNKEKKLIPIEDLRRQLGAQLTAETANAVVIPNIINYVADEHKEEAKKLILQFLDEAHANITKVRDQLRKEYLDGKAE